MVVVFSLQLWLRLHTWPFSILEGQWYACACVCCTSKCVDLTCDSHSHMHLHIHAHTHAPTFMHTHAHTCTHIHIHAHTYTYMHTHTCTHTYIYTHTYTCGTTLFPVTCSLVMCLVSFWASRQQPCARFSYGYVAYIPFNTSQ